MEQQKQGHRRLIAIGGSVGVTLPRSWLKQKGWKVGDRVGIVYGDIMVIIKPQEPKDTDAVVSNCVSENRSEYNANAKTRTNPVLVTER